MPHADVRPGFVHLAEHKGGLTLFHLVHIDVGDVPLILLHTLGKFFAIFDDAALDHLAEKVVTLAGTLADTGEHREAVVAFGNVVDELHDEHSLAHTGTTEEADLAAFGVRLKQVDHLDAGIEYLGADGEVIKFGGWLMYRTQIVAVELRESVDSFADHIEEPTFDLIAGRNSYGAFEIVDAGATTETVGAFHCHTPYSVFAYVLLYFEYQHRAVGTIDFQGGVDGGSSSDEPSKATSTTGPITWAMVPYLSLIA